MYLMRQLTKIIMKFKVSQQRAGGDGEKFTDIRNNVQIWWKIIEIQEKAIKMGESKRLYAKNC